MGMLHKNPDISLVNHCLCCKELLKSTVSKVNGARDRLANHPRSFNKELSDIGTADLLLNSGYSRQSPDESLGNRFHSCFRPTIPYKPVREVGKQEPFLSI